MNRLYTKILHLQLRSVGGMIKISVPLIQVWLLQVLFHLKAQIFPPTKNCKQMEKKLVGNCRKNVGVTVTGARPCGASVLLQHRFQPLQMLMGDHHVESQLDKVCKVRIMISTLLQKL